MAVLFQLIVTALLPVLVLLVYIYLRDKYQREPVGQILKGVGWGILSIPVSLLMALLIDTIGWNAITGLFIHPQVNEAFGGAAIPEETAKLLMLWLFLRKNKYFDEHVDGIVYAVAVSMGFAGVENLLYLFQNADHWLSVGIMRAAFSVPGHYAFAVFMGYYYSLYCLGRPDHRVRNLFLAWGSAVIAHGIYDSLLFMSGVVPSVLSGIILVLFLVFCYFMHRFANKHIRKHLARDASFRCKS